jgi:hypothetical protein
VGAPNLSKNPRSKGKFRLVLALPEIDGCANAISEPAYDIELQQRVSSCEATP